MWFCCVVCIVLWLQYILKNSGIKVLNCPVLNPIENIYHIMGSKIFEQKKKSCYFDLTTGKNNRIWNHEINQDWD